jgi:hypothetical protein
MVLNVPSIYKMAHSVKYFKLVYVEKAIIFFSELLINKNNSSQFVLILPKFVRAKCSSSKFIGNFGIILERA